MIFRYLSYKCEQPRKNTRRRFYPFARTRALHTIILPVRRTWNLRPEENAKPRKLLSRSVVGRYVSHTWPSRRRR